MDKLKSICKAAAASAVAFIAMPAHAVIAQPDLADVTTYIETGLTTIGVLASAGLVLFVGLKLYKVARRAV